MSKEKNTKSVEYDATQDDDFDKRSVGSTIRDEKGKISQYYFKIYRRDQEPLEGTLTREQMELIYRNYSALGANLTQRTVSRDFPYTLSDFKRILRAFNVTKASVPFPEHILEERSPEELSQLIVQQKEVDLLKLYEQDKGNLYKKKYAELFLQYQKLKDSTIEAQEIVKEIDSAQFITKVNTNGQKSIIVYLSDMHIGAYVSQEGVYDNTYNEQEVHRRLNKVLNELASYDDLDEIVIINLGDAIDGYDATTTRPGSTHTLPQNLSNKEQGQVLLRQMSGFFKYIQDNIPYNKLKFYSVGHSNHGGDFEHSIITALSIMLEATGVECKISTRPIDHFTIKDKTIIYLHGKDNLDQYKNFPLVLNDKTELYFNEYMIHHNITGEVLVVKGDLHRTATTYGKIFKYKSVGSLFGSSNWMHANFGFTRWCCDFTIIDKKGNMLDGLIKD